MDDICRFIRPPENNNDTLDIINYVLETKQQVYSGLNANSIYRLHLVLQGEGTLHTPSHTQPLKRGDIFFTTPAVPSAIESGEDFQFIYISFLGGRANALIDAFHINGGHCVFSGFEFLLEMWQNGLHVGANIVELRSEGILLYTFSVLGERLLHDENKEKQNSEAALLIKKYVDDHFSDPELSLDQVSRGCSYNPKYVSTIFKAKFKITFSEYLNTIRIQHACVLMEQGFTGVKNIALMCGFKDPMYFSKVFRGKLGVAPRLWMAKTINGDIGGRRVEQES